MISKLKGKHMAKPWFSCIVLAMKLTVVLLAAAVLQVSAKGYSQQVTINEKDIAVTSLLQIIEKQTSYHFLYDKLQMKDIVIKQVAVSNASVERVLNESFEGLPLSYKIIRRTIVVKRNKQAPSAPVVANVVPPVQQDIIVTGLITNPNGEPLADVSVLLKGKNIGTTTDINGEFSIRVPDERAVLVFSYVGYESREITTGSQKYIKMVLQPSAGALGDVVVVAYGKQKKISVTGAIASISTKEIKQSPAANLAVTLAGRLPGLFAQQISGEPGRDVTQLFMRGQGTLNGSAPIILVDGVERELTAIDPNEVETVTILKDASSTALFGVRGANGVILVTTKRGTETTPSIGLTVETGLQTFTRWPTQVDAYNWVQLKNQAWANDNPDPGANDKPPYSDYAVERFRLQDQPETYPDHNWINELTKKYVPQTRYNLNLNGKGANVGYFVNVGFLNQSGQWKIDPGVTAYDPSQFMKRYNFRSNIDAHLNKAKTLRTFLNASGYLEKVNGPYVEARFDNSTATAEIIDRILNLWPTVQPGPTTPDDEVLIGGGNLDESPWAYINRSGYRQESRSNLTASWGLEQDLNFLTRGLSTRMMLSFDTRSLHYLNGSKQYQFWVQVIDPNSQTPDGKDKVIYQRTRTDFDNMPLSTSTSASFQSFYEMQWHINYNRVFNGRHVVTGLLMAQQQSLIKPSDVLPFNVRGLATRLTYGYADRYLAEFNAGYNGSEQFAPGRRYGFFPSFSAGWNIHNETFFSNIRSTVNLLKIRGSYGIVGGDQLGGRRFLYLDDIQRGGDSYSETLARGGNINESFFGNPNVQWEVAKKSNVGLELGLLRQLTLTADVFSERRDNVLIYRGSIPMMIGVPAESLAPANIGIIENKGYELELNYNKTFGTDFSVIAKVNFNYAKNKILFNDEVMLDEDFAYRYRSTGYMIGQQWGYNVLGFFSSEEEINAYGVDYQGQSPRPGDLKYEDLNDDGIIDEKDLMPIGYATVPLYNWGAAANITYKNFDVSFLFQGAFKVSGNYNPWEKDDFRQRHMHAWTPERAISGYNIQYPALSLTSSSSQTNNTFFNENRSFVRLKNIEVGYSLPYNLINKVGMRNLRIYCNGLNIFTWDKMKQKDWDPELGSTTSFPVYRIFNFGINATF